MVQVRLDARNRRGGKARRRRRHIVYASRDVIEAVFALRIRRGVVLDVGVLVRGGHLRVDHPRSGRIRNRADDDTVRSLPKAENRKRK